VLTGWGWHYPRPGPTANYFPGLRRGVNAPVVGSLISAKLESGTRVGVGMRHSGLPVAVPVLTQQTSRAGNGPACVGVFVKVGAGVLCCQGPVEAFVWRLA